MQIHRFYIYTGIAISIVLIILSAVIANNQTKLTSRAQVPRSTSFFSIVNSYVFVSPISANADGVSIIRVTVFLLNDQGLGVAGQRVSLQVSGPVNIAQTEPITDSFGRAIFDLTSSNPGNYTVIAEVTGASLEHRASISFR